MALYCLEALAPLELFALAPLGGERGRERGTPPQVAMNV